MKITFFDDEPEIYPLQYGGKARTITNLAKEFIKLPEVEKVTILSRSINSTKKEFSIDDVDYVALNDKDTIERIAYEMENADILNIHCCSFTFPQINGHAKKFYFLHDVLIATAEKGSHLDKSLGGNFDAIIAPSEFAKSIYDINKAVIGGKTNCHVIPRHIDINMFFNISKNDILCDKNVPKEIMDILEQYKYILFFPNRPIEEKGGKYLIELAKKLDKCLENYCIIGPFSNNKLAENFIDTNWIESKNLKYYYSISNVTLNFSELPESFSQICLESAYCGTPVVAFESGNIPNLSKKIDNIILTDKNIDSIVQNIKKAILLKEDKKKAKIIQDKIQKEFGVKTIIKEYINLYKKYMEK